MAAMLVLLTPLCVVAQNNDTTATGDTSRAALLTVVEVDEGGTRHAISSTSRRGIVDINSSILLQLDKDRLKEVFAGSLAEGDPTLDTAIVEPRHLADLSQQGLRGAEAVRTGMAAVAARQEMAKISSTGVVDRETRVALKDWLQNGHTKSNPPSEDIAAAPPADGITFIEPRIGHFSQGKPLWASKVLGRDRTIARSGCAITCVAMILRHHGRDVDPGSLDAFLDANDGYVGDSVKWGVAGGCGARGDDAVVYGRVSGTADELRPVIHERLETQRPTMVRVDYGSDAGLKYNHFVLAAGRTEDGNIVMNDPAT